MLTRQVILSSWKNGRVMCGPTRISQYRTEVFSVNQAELLCIRRSGRKPHLLSGKFYNRSEQRAEFSGEARDRVYGATPLYEGCAPALWQQVADGAQVWHFPAPIGLRGACVEL